MRPALGLVEPELRTPGDHLDLVGHVVHERVAQRERARHTVDEGDHVHTEADLQRAVLVEVVEDHIRVGVTLEFDDQAGGSPGAFVTDLTYALDGSGVGQLGDLLGDALHGGLVGNLGDDDPFAARVLLDLGTCTQFHRTAAGPERRDQARTAHDHPAGREVRTLHELHQLVGGGVGVVEQVDGCVDDLTQVVGGDVGRHADSDSLAAVDQQVREPPWQHRGFVAGGIERRCEVDGLLVDPGQHLHRDVGQSALRVAVGSRWVRR